MERQLLRDTARAMSVQIEELAASVLEALNRRDPDALLALCHPDYEFRSQLVAVEGKVYSGPDGMHSYIRDLEDGFTDIHFTMEEIIGTPETGMVAVIRFQGLGRESGVPIDNPTYQVWTLRDGKPVGNTIYAVKAEALEAAGLSE